MIRRFNELAYLEKTSNKVENAVKVMITACSLQRQYLCTVVVVECKLFLRELWHTVILSVNHTFLAHKELYLIDNTLLF